MLLGSKIMTETAPVGRLCKDRDDAMSEIFRLSRMLGAALSSTYGTVTARDYLSTITEVRAIRLHLAAIREQLAQHRAEHGC
jgi:hypothetical protein